MAERLGHTLIIAFDLAVDISLDTLDTWAHHDPADHPMLEARDCFLIHALCFGAANIEVGRAGLRMIEKHLGHTDITVGCLIVLGGDAATEQNRSKGPHR